MISKSESEWEAESDARTIAEAEVIRNDSARLIKAQAAAKRLADEARERAEAMERAAKGIGLYPNSPLPPKKG